MSEYNAMMSQLRMNGDFAMQGICHTAKFLPALRLDAPSRERSSTLQTMPGVGWDSGKRAETGMEMEMEVNGDIHVVANPLIDGDVFLAARGVNIPDGHVIAAEFEPTLGLTCYAPRPEQIAAVNDVDVSIELTLPVDILLGPPRADLSLEADNAMECALHVRRAVRLLVSALAVASVLGGCADQRDFSEASVSVLLSQTVGGGSAARFKATEASDPSEPQAAVVQAAVPGSSSVSEAARQPWAFEAAAAIEAGRSDTQRTPNIGSARYDWIEIDIHDQYYPLRVDIVGSVTTPARGVVYMLPGGASNFRSSYFMGEEGLAARYSREGFLVVGISAREDRVPQDLEDTRFMQEWGMKARREDIRSVVSRIQAAVPLPYEMVGHSWGAASALDYASVYSSELQRVVALDIFSIDPAADPTGVNRARRTYDAHVTLMASGVFADTSYADFSSVLGQGLDDSMPDSTSKELMLFGLIYSAVIPGMHTTISGLPGDWPMTVGALAGEYESDLDQREVDQILSHTSSATLRTVARELGTGVISTAFSRDVWAVGALDDSYPLRWQDIATDVVWLNAELGFAEKSYGAELIRQAGNERVQVEIIAGYGHSDLLWGRTADADVWQRLF